MAPLQVIRYNKYISKKAKKILLHLSWQINVTHSLWVINRADLTFIDNSTLMNLMKLPFVCAEFSADVVNISIIKFSQSRRFIQFCDVLFFIF